MMRLPLPTCFRSAVTAAAGVLTLGFLPLAAMADDLATVLPEDSLFFGEMRSVPKLMELENLPVIKKLSDGPLGKMFDKLMEDGPGEEKMEKIFKEETGLSTDEALAKFTGGLAAGVSLPLDKLLADDEDAEPGIVLVADFSGDEALVKKVITAAHKISEAETEAAKEKIKAAAKASGSDDDEDDDDADADSDDDDDADLPEAKFPDDYEEKVAEVEGVSVHSWAVKDAEKTEGEKFSWAIADGRLIIGVAEADIKDAVSRQIKKSSEGSLASTAAYKKIDTAAGDWDVLAGANLERGLSTIQEAIRKQMEKGEFKSTLPVNPLQVWTGLGADQLRTAFMAWDLQGEELDFHASLTYAEKPGLLKLYAANGPGEPPLFAPEDAGEVGWGTMDWGKLFDNLKEVAAAVSPMAAGGLDMGVNTLKTKIGVDIRKDILGQMGDNLWSFSKVTLMDKDKKADAEEALDGNPFGALGIGQSQVLGIALRDAKAFELSLKSIFNTAAPGQALFEDREYLGSTIHTVKNLPPPVQMAWLIKADTLIISIGQPDLLEKALANMEKKPATPLLEREFVQKAFAKLPDGQVSAGYYDAGMLADAMIQGMKGAMAGFGGDEGEFGEALSALPDKLDIPLSVVTRAYISDKSADLRMRTVVKP